METWNRAVVMRKDHTVFAAVDRVRSITLFYEETQERVFIREDAEWVHQNVGNTKMDDVARMGDPPRQAGRRSRK